MTKTELRLDPTIEDLVVEYTSFIKTDPRDYVDGIVAEKLLEDVDKTARKLTGTQALILQAKFSKLDAVVKRARKKIFKEG